MPRTCIAVVDATRARLFTLDRTHAPDGSHEQLIEHPSLQAPRGASSSDPAHIHVIDLAFAGKVAAEIQRLVHEPGVRRLIVCGNVRMIGEVFAASTASLRRPGLIIDEVARDLHDLTAAQIRDELAACHVLPVHHDHT